MSRAGATVILAVGDEILAGFIQDTNSHFLARHLRDTDHPCHRIEVVGDVVEDIAAAVRRAVADAAVTRVLVCGGVGPTPDDRTFEGVSAGLGRPLDEHPQVLLRLQGIVQRMHEAGWIDTAELSAPNRRMASVPRGAMVIENRRGMAPGLAFVLGGDEDQIGNGDGRGDDDEPPAAARWLFVLPGVPSESHTIFEEELLPHHFGALHARALVELRYAFAIEAEFAEPMAVVSAEFPGVSIGSYPQSATRELVMRLRGDDAETVQRAADRLDGLRVAQRGGVGSPVQPPPDGPLGARAWSRNL